MSTEQKKDTVVTTPIGEVKWFKLVNPDQKYNKYSVDIILEDSEEVQKLIARIDDMIETTVMEEQAKAKPNMKKKIMDSQSRPIEAEYDDEGNETGRYIMKLRQNAQYKDKKTGEMKKMYPPALFDGKGKVIPADAKSQLFVGNGSTARAQITLSPYCLPTGSCGVSCRPNGVQLVTVVAGGNGGSDASFDAVEGGFEASFSPVTEDSGDGDF